MEIGTEAWAVIGLTITGVLTYLGVRRTARASERAGQTTATIDASATALGGFKELTDSLHAELRRRDEAIKRVEDRQGDMEEKANTQAEEIEALQSENRRQSILLDDLGRRYRTAIRHIVELRRWGQQHSSAADLPPVPQELLPSPEDLLADMED